MKTNEITVAKLVAQANQGTKATKFILSVFNTLKKEIVCPNTGKVINKDLAKFLKDAEKTFTGNVLEVISLLTFDEALKLLANDNQYTGKVVTTLVHKYVSLELPQRAKVAERSQQLNTILKECRTANKFDLFGQLVEHYTFNTVMKGVKLSTAKNILAISPKFFIDNKLVETFAAEGVDKLDAFTEFVEKTYGLSELEFYKLVDKHPTLTLRAAIAAEKEADKVGLKESEQIAKLEAQGYTVTKA